jgi:hypothetical protein
MLLAVVMAVVAQTRALKEQVEKAVAVVVVVVTLRATAQMVVAVSLSCVTPTPEQLLLVQV